MNVTFISDTHGAHPVLEGGDVLVHCGDITNTGTLQEIINEFLWLRQQPYDHILFVPGNHDVLCDKEPYVAENLAFPEITILHNKGIEIEGFSFYGTSDQPIYAGWAFGKTPEQMARAYENIPDNLDVLITHCPPCGVLDYTINHEYVGSKELLAAVVVRRPKYHAFGHIHEGWGNIRDYHTNFMNCSIMSVRYEPIQLPFQIIL